jgi:hypothetical protein
MNRVKTQGEALATEKSPERSSQVIGASELPRVRGGVPVKAGVRAGVWVAYTD